MKKKIINKVVFPTGAVPDLDNKNLLMFSGRADSIVSIKKSFKEIFKKMNYF